MIYQQKPQKNHSAKRPAKIKTVSAKKKKMEFSKKIFIVTTAVTCSDYLFDRSYVGDDGYHAVMLPHTSDICRNGNGNWILLPKSGKGEYKGRHSIRHGYEEESKRA